MVWKDRVLRKIADEHYEAVEYTYDDEGELISERVLENFGM